jgi:hypothetical protein
MRQLQALHPKVEHRLGVALVAIRLDCDHLLDDHNGRPHGARKGSTRVEAHLL